MGKISTAVTKLPRTGIIIVCAVVALMIIFLVTSISLARCKEGFKAERDKAQEPDLSILQPKNLMNIMRQATNVTKYIFDDSIWTQSFENAGLNPVEVARRQILKDLALKKQNTQPE